MRRLLSVLVVGPLSMAAGFYVASFAYQLITQLLFYVASLGLVALYVLGLVSGSSDAGTAPLILLDLARSNDTATYAAGSIGALATLVLVTRTIVVGPRAPSWRGAVRFGAVAAGVASLTAGADLWYGVTPYVGRLIPHTDFATAERDVTCPMSVLEIATTDIKGNGCVTDVEGVLVYSNGRFELHREDGQLPSIQVHFFRGRRSLFSETNPRLPPRYYDQVGEFVGKRVHIIGTAVLGAVSADVGHVVLADARAPRTPLTQ